MHKNRKKGRVTGCINTDKKRGVKQVHKNGRKEGRVEATDIS